MSFSQQFQHNGSHWRMGTIRAFSASITCAPFAAARNATNSDKSDSSIPTWANRDQAQFPVWASFAQIECNHSLENEYRTREDVRSSFVFRETLTLKGAPYCRLIMFISKSLIG